MAEDSVAGFGFPAICSKKVTAALDGGRLTSDGGVPLLAQAERAMDIAGRLAGFIADLRTEPSPANLPAYRDRAALRAAGNCVPRPSATSISDCQRTGGKGQE